MPTVVQTSQTALATIYKCIGVVTRNCKHIVFSEPDFCRPHILKSLPRCDFLVESWRNDEKHVFVRLSGDLYRCRQHSGSSIYWAAVESWAEASLVF